MVEIDLPMLTCLKQLVHITLHTLQFDTKNYHFELFVVDYNLVNFEKLQK